MQISVVIPNFNGRKLLQKNLPYVIKALKPYSHEIIVVDDASTDDSVDYLSKHFPKVKIFVHSQNQRFAITCNTGVKRAKGDIVILLNSDVVPKKDFLSFVIPLFKDKKVFSVGFLEIDQDPGGKKFDQKKDIKNFPRSKISGKTGFGFKRGLFVHWREHNQQSGEVFWNFGGSMAVDRKKYLQLKGFDKDFAPAYWEDVDLGYRAKQKGWKILFSASAVVFHHHETTNKDVFGKQNLQIMSFRNQILFCFKHMNFKQKVLHYLWLPYHLLFTNKRSNGLFLKGYLQAMKKYEK